MARKVLYWLLAILDMIKVMLYFLLCIQNFTGNFVNPTKKSAWFLKAKDKRYLVASDNLNLKIQKNFNTKFSWVQWNLIHCKNPYRVQISCLNACYRRLFSLSCIQYILYNDLSFQSAVKMKWLNVSFLGNMTMFYIYYHKCNTEWIILKNIFLVSTATIEYRTKTRKKSRIYSKRHPYHLLIYKGIKCKIYVMIN